jgi:hypothetical protein
MSLSDLAAVGSFVSGIAIVFSFIFLALQVHQIQSQPKIAHSAGSYRRNVDTLLKMADAPMSETLTAADTDCVALSSAQIWSFHGFAGRTVLFLRSRFADADVPGNASFKFGDLFRTYLAKEFAPEGSR